MTDRFDGRLDRADDARRLVPASGRTARLERARLLIPDTPCREPSVARRRRSWRALTGGSAIPFLAALPWVYHEAYLWARCAVATLAGLVALRPAPTVAVARVTACSLPVTILTRTTSGWACARRWSRRDCRAVAAAGRARRGRRGIAAAAATAIVVGVAVNWAKFRHPYLFPLDHQVWTALNETRAAALDANGGHLTGPQFLPTMAHRVPQAGRDPLHLRVPVDHVAGRTPFPSGVGPSSTSATAQAASRHSCRCTFALSFAGLIALVRSRQADRAILRLTALAALVNPRADLRLRLRLPPVHGRVPARARGPQRRRSHHPVAPRAGPPTVVATGLPYAIVVAGAYGIAVHSAMSVESARMTGRGAPLESLVDRRLESSGLSGDDPAPTPTSSGALPSHPPTDQLAVVGDCEAVYLATGDLYEPWVPVAIRGLDVSVSVPEHLGPGETTLVRLNGPRRRALILQHDGIGNVRLAVVGNAVDERVDDSTPLEPGVTVRLSISARTSRNQFLIDTPQGGFTRPSPWPTGTTSGSACPTCSNRLGRRAPSPRRRRRPQRVGEAAVDLCRPRGHQGEIGQPVGAHGAAPSSTSSTPAGDPSNGPTSTPKVRAGAVPSCSNVAKWNASSPST